MGCLIGDHVKTAIGTMLNTGTVIDVVANLFGYCETPKYIAPFTWGTKDKYDAEKAFETAVACAKRRNIDFDDTEKKLFKYLAELI